MADDRQKIQIEVQVFFRGWRMIFLPPERQQIRLRFTTTRTLIRSAVAEISFLPGRVLKVKITIYGHPLDETHSLDPEEHEATRTIPLGVSIEGVMTVIDHLL